MDLEPCLNIIGNLGNLENNPYVSMLSGKIANIANKILAKMYQLKLMGRCEAGGDPIAVEADTRNRRHRSARFFHAKVFLSNGDEK